MAPFCTELLYITSVFRKMTLKLFQNPISKNYVNALAKHQRRRPVRKPVKTRFMPDQNTLYAIRHLAEFRRLPHLFLHLKEKIMAAETNRPNEVTYKFNATDIRKLLEPNPDYFLIKTSIEPREVNNEQLGVVVIVAEAYTTGQTLVGTTTGCPVPPCVAK